MLGPIQLYPAVTQGALGALQGEGHIPVRVDRSGVPTEQLSLPVYVRHDAWKSLGEVGPHVAQYDATRGLVHALTDDVPDAVGRP